MHVVEDIKTLITGEIVRWNLDRTVYAFIHDNAKNMNELRDDNCFVGQLTKEANITWKTCPDKSGV